MKSFQINIQNPTGLHARPAKIFVNAAKEFDADIRVHHGQKKANAKSLISMLALGVETGAAIRVEIDGADEDAAVNALQTLIASGLGEAEAIAAEAVAVVDPPAVTQSGAGAPPADPGDGALRGVSGAPGVAIGPLFQLRHTKLEAEAPPFESVEAERGRLRRATGDARAQLAQLRDRLRDRGATEEAEIFDVHRELLDDPELLAQVNAAIDEQNSAARAWRETIEARAQVMAGLNDATLAARAADLRDVGDRVLRLLLGAPEEGLRLPDRPVILIADDLTPSDTASLSRDRVLGFCTARGGPTAHTAIIARALQLPAVVSAGPAVLDLKNDTTVVLDGNAGVLIVDPDEETIAARKKARDDWMAARAAAARSAADPAVTTDGHRVEVVANIGGVEDARRARAAGAEGVGLLRTEFLFLDRGDPPDEEEQLQVYGDIAAAMDGQPVIVRTLDIGGDKPLPYVDVPEEENPFLGVRGIRLCLERPELLRGQLRAILRAVRRGRLRIMFPMVSDVGEWRRARRMVDEVRAEIGAPEVDVGIMIEVPSAALMADVLAAEVDFFSVGTNDLTQYTLAMDRLHPTLASQSDGLHPAVLRLIQMTVRAAHAHGKWVGVCGELGADPQAVPILVGLGVDELSVSVPAIPTVKAQIRTIALEEARALAQKALACATAADVRALV